MPSFVLKLLRTGTAKSACAAIGCVEVLNQIEFRLHDRDNDHLCDALEWLDGECRITAIPSGDHELALIVGINQADEVAQYHAVFVSQATAWQNHGGVVGVGQMNGQTGGDEHGLTGFEGDFFADAGAKIKAGAACCGIMRQLVFDQWIDDFNVNVHGEFLIE